MRQAAKCISTCPKVLVLLGSNVTSENSTNAQLIGEALLSLEAAGLRINQTSPYYSTACVPKGAGPDFVNLAAALDTDLPPQQVLTLLHQVEADFGRERHVRWGQRSLDIDLIAYGDRIEPDAALLRHWIDLPLDAQMTQAPDQLILPHPRLQDRAFVLIPLADIAPDWTHPLTQKTVAQMVQDLPEADKLGVNLFERP